MKCLTIIFLSLFVISCGQLNHRNFNNQKFTHLRSQKADVDVSNDMETKAELILNEQSEKANNTDAVNSIQSQKSEISLLQEDDNAVNFQIDNPDIIVASIKSKLKQDLILQNPQHSIIGNPREFEKLSEDEKTQSLIKFNKIFNHGLGIFFGAVLVGLLGLMIWEFFLLAAALIFIMWIMSFVALAKVRRIDKSKLNNNIVIKLGLAQFVCGVGIAVCIVTVIGGVILGILFLAKVI